MTDALRSWSAARGRIETSFWRAAAGVTGFAVRHPRLTGAIPVAVLSVAAFFFGRFVGLKVIGP